MYEVDFSKPIHIHFIGIGGISMSGLAEILLKESFTISGSDAKESDLTRHLTSLGAQVFYGQKAENILPGTDLVVYTAARHCLRQWSRCRSWRRSGKKPREEEIRFPSRRTA